MWLVVWSVDFYIGVAFAVIKRCLLREGEAVRAGEACMRLDEFAGCSVSAEETKSAWYLLMETVAGIAVGVRC